MTVPCSTLPHVRTRAFSLVEMLVVIGIISILLAVSVPAFRGFNQSQSRKAAVGSVMAALDHARMMAITQGRAAYFVVACKCVTGASGQINPAMWGKAYAIFQDADNINFKPTQITPWFPLPTGIAFKVNSAGGTMTSITSQPASTSATLSSFPLTSIAATNGSSPAQLPYIKFDTAGLVDASEPYATNVLMFPGTVDTNGAEIVTQNASGTSTTAKAALIEEIDVNSATGRAKYVTNTSDNLQASPSPTATP